jgi:hypothetical protein
MPTPLAGLDEQAVVRLSWAGISWAIQGVVAVWTPGDAAPIGWKY